MKRFYLLAVFALVSVIGRAQFVTVTPSSAGADDSPTLIFDASEGNGELQGADKVYMHHGVITDSPTGTDWQYVLGNWGQDDGVGEMTRVPGETDKWQIQFTPSIREYFNVPPGEDVFRISGVFRSADGGTKGTIAPGDYGWGTSASNLDLFINLDVENFLLVTAPTTDQTFAFPGQPIVISAQASSNVTSMKVWLDEGEGFEEKRSISSGTSINYTYFPSSSVDLKIRFTATINGEDLEVERDHEVTFVGNTEEVELPAGMVAGINYGADDTKATLVLQAPGKTFAHVVGDFNNWSIDENYQMKKSPDGEYFWLEVEGLTPGEPYVFQYWVDGTVRIGDPYATQVADPWNDGFIEDATFPNVPTYTRTDNGPASVIQTGGQPYEWDASEASWERPDVDHLMIYELLVRDFISTHDWQGLIDTLDYLQGLGIDAIELMPFNEFEGNESWGYNPNYYFAVDKYYGPKDDLKRFIEIAHQKGMAVIMDMVLNHAYGTNPMVRLYWDASTNSPTADNPWFNRVYVGPFDWGFDFNHESQYTKDFMDRVNRFWIEEFHVDGYRFDFTKGFTQNAPGGSLDGFDQSRIDILKRMADEIWAVDDEAYVILEHWGPGNEEQQLADYGMKMWSNRTYDMVQPIVGNPAAGNFSAMDRTAFVSLFNSHDERRVAEHALTEGRTEGSYDVKNPLVMFERMKLMAAFGYLQPGLKLIWQFDEIGYDININFNGRTGNKPLPWGEGGLGYYDDPERLRILEAYRAILNLRKDLTPAAMAAASTNHQHGGQVRRLNYDMDGTDLIVIGNFGLSTSSISPEFTEAGTWYDFFSGEEIMVTNTSAPVELKAGEWYIYTSERMSDGFPDVVAVYDNPVTINPTPFTQNETITIRFDATKASPADTDGLVGAEKVYMQAGVALSPNSNTLDVTVGNNTDDGVGLMTEVEDDIWEITLTIADYFSLMESDEAYKIGMYFRDANGENLGYGFRNSVIFYDIASDQPFITVTPAAFRPGDEITVTFNARRGNRELLGANKVYMHSSVDLTNTTTPWNSAWDNVVGDWGADNGVGEMSRVDGQTDVWEISLTPGDYYGLNNDDVIYWLAMVFRSADGNIKGTGTPGPIENGLIHTNLDFFIQNQIVVDTDDIPQDDDAHLRLYPNPTSNLVQLEINGIDSQIDIFVRDVNGRSLYQQTVPQVADGYLHSLDVSQLPNGLYYVQLVGAQGIVTKELVVRR